MAEFGPDNKRWAQRAREAQFSELGSVRASAEQWRNGLAGLTALLSAAALVTSPTLGSTVAGGWRTVVGLLVVAGLITLMVGSWRAMQAAFGVPGAQMPLTGERLKTWEHAQAVDAVGKLEQARAAFVVGIGLVVAASAVAFFAQPSPPGGPSVVVTSSTEVLCGHLSNGDAGVLALTTPDGRAHHLALKSVTGVTVVPGC